MSRAGTCPDVQDLRRFALGQTAEGEAERLEDHLAQCPACVNALATLHGEDTLTEAVRGQASAAAQPDPASVVDLIERLQELRPPEPGADTDVTNEMTPQHGVSAKKREAGTNTRSLPLEQEAPTVARSAELSSASLPGAALERHDYLAPAEQPGEIGRLGQYRILKVLGRGGMGVVFQAKDPQLDRLVALKTMLPAMAASLGARQRFEREARAAAAIKHDHIVTIHQVGEDRSVPFLAMELLEGESLDDRLKRENKLVLPEVLRIGREIAEGLAVAHERGLVHRDIKPANIWLEAVVRSPWSVAKEKQPGSARDYGPPPTDFRVKILDFGLARAASDTAGLTQLGAILGTPAYMAPEQSRNLGVDHRADLFSLGCVLYRMTTGELPFKGTDMLSMVAALALDSPRPPHQLSPQVPSGLSDLIMRLLAKEPAERPASAAAVIEALEAISEDPVRRPTRRAFAVDMDQTGALSLAPRSRQKARRPIAVVLVPAGALLLLLGLGLLHLRIATPHGEIIIESDDPDVQVSVMQGAKLVTILDTKSKQKVQLDTGAYTLALSGDVKGLKLEAPETFTLTRGEERIVRVRRVPVFAAKPPPAKKDEIRVFQHDGAVWSVRFSPDGRRAVFSGDCGIIHWQDVETGQEVGRFQGHRGRVEGLAFSRDGRRLASGSNDGTVRVWDVPNSKELRRFDVPGGSPCVALSPDGRYVISGTQADASLRLFDVEQGQEVRQLHGHAKRVTEVAFSADGRRAASASDDGAVRLWDVPTGAALRCFKGHSWATYGVAFSPDGSYVLSGGGGNDRTLRLWSTETGKEVRRFQGHTAGVIPVAISPDGRCVLSGGNDTTMRLWDVASGRELHCFKGHTRWVEQIDFSPDGRRALSASPDGTVRLWRLSDPDSGEVRRFEGHTDGVQQVAFSPDGHRALSTSNDHTMRLWDVDSGQELQRFLGHGAPAVGLAFSPDGRTALSSAAEPDNTLRLWDTGSGKELQAFKGHTAGVYGVAFSPNGRRALSSSNQPDCTVRLWDVHTGQELQSFPDTLASSVSFSPDGRYIFGGKDKVLFMAEAETGKQIREFQGHTAWVRGVALSRDGQRVLSGSMDGTVRLWDVDSGAELRCFRGHTSGVVSVALSSDGRRAVSGGYDMILRLWDVKTGTQSDAFIGHTHIIHGVAISPDGQYALSGAWDRTVRLWRLPDASGKRGDGGK